MKKILVVEDDRVLSEELVILLSTAGYAAEAVTDFAEAPVRMKEGGADLILLDITLPEKNGNELLTELRKVSSTPVIMLTSRTSELDEAVSMSRGADDYVTKPYNPTILLLRISAVLRRASGSPEKKIYRGAEFSPVRGSVTRDGREEILTKNEAIIYSLLLERQGEIVTRDALMTALWDNDEYVSDNALSVNVSRLRAKLEALGLPDALETRKKQGYILK